MPIEIDRNKCIYCGACVAVCPFMALRLCEVRIEEKGCTDCGICPRACPMGAITLKKEKK